MVSKTRYHLLCCCIMVNIGLNGFLVNVDYHIYGSAMDISLQNTYTIFGLPQTHGYISLGWA